MKTVKLIAGAFALASLLFSVEAFAQENGNRDENGKVVRGPYETNGAFDNTFVHVGLGVNTVYDNGELGNWALGTKLDVGKWVTPSLGARFGWNGYSVSPKAYQDWYDSKSTYAFNYISGGILWNVLNTVSGYKETRFYEPILGVNAGVVAVGRDLSYGSGFTLLNNFHLSNRIDVNLELSALVLRGADVGVGRGTFCTPLSATVGVAFNLFKTGFDRHSTVTPAIIPVPFTTEQYHALEAKVAALETENSQLKNRIAQLEAENAKFQGLVEGQTYVYQNGQFVACEGTVASPATIYFDCGSTVISSREAAHLEFYAQNALNADSKLTIVGSADKQTGSARRNKQLSEQRANAVKKVLVNTYGLNPDNIEVVAEGDTNNVYNTPAKNRVATITIK